MCETGWDFIWQRRRPKFLEIEPKITCFCCILVWNKKIFPIGQNFFFKNRKQKMTIEIFSGFEHINFLQKLIFPKENKFVPE